MERMSISYHKAQHEQGWKNYLLNNNMANIAWFFVGGIAGTAGIGLLLQKFGHSAPIVKAAWITLVIICLKELADQVSKYTIFCGRFGLDPAGGDWRDILLGFLGILSTLSIIGW